MGSKRSSSKASKPPSTPLPATLPADENFQNPSSHNPDSPFKSQKKNKLPTSNSTDSGFSPTALPPKSKKHKLPTPTFTDSGFSPPVLPPKSKKNKLPTPTSTDSGFTPPVLPPKSKKHKLSTPKSTDSGLSPTELPPKGKKQKLTTPNSTDSGFCPTVPPADDKAPSQNINRKGKTPDISSEISPGDGRASRPSSAHWSNLKFLESLITFRSKHGVLPTQQNMEDYLKEISDWAPSTLSEKNVHNKIRHLRYTFQKNPELRPESSEHERMLHKLRLQLWGPETLKAKGSAMKGQKEKAASKKLNGKKQNLNDDEDELEEEGDDEHDKGGDEKAVETMEKESVKEHEKDDDALVGEDNGLLDGGVTEFPYKYLKLALEEYWTEAKLNMNTLYSALPKVDPVQAKLLDEQYSEVFKGMLKLKMEKNEMFNKIIRSYLGD